jgi:D-sedoheptulose 7-phosphate isomerase
MVFAQQVNGFGCKGDTLLTLTTSGNSLNCVYAAIVAKAKGMKVIAITGENGGRMKELADICIRVPEKETYLVQELTLPIYHYICAKLEETFFA